eukprot:Blabericola_migrator_1__11734@NODE_70_length_15323_cov_105_367593_g63_i0_p6_GENE_NODE_70_length_15323_cov_105_367593_g63_i0NODE_70_length_15323_cov_105_367593_g63_i0_p6_ORF_typecomplete_len309_score31_18RIIa/PF02197_17/0_23_NODE_70_length_15323_cov_105_367593_g63_i055306456
MSLTLSGLFGLSLFTTGASVHGQKALRACEKMTSVNWRRVWVFKKKSSQDEGSGSDTGGPSQTDTDDDSSETWYGKRSVELGWGSRGASDILSHWADFYTGLQVALWWPPSSESFPDGTGLIPLGTSKSGKSLPFSVCGRLRDPLKWMFDYFEDRLEMERHGIVTQQLNSPLVLAMAQPTSPVRSGSAVESPLNYDAELQGMAGGDIPEVAVAETAQQTPARTPPFPHIVQAVRPSLGGDVVESVMLPNAMAEMYSRLWRGLRRTMFWSGALVGLGLQVLDFVYPCQNRFLIPGLSQRHEHRFDQIIH